MDGRVCGVGTYLSEPTSTPYRTTRIPALRTPVFLHGSEFTINTLHTTTTTCSIYVSVCLFCNGALRCVRLRLASASCVCEGWLFLQAIAESGKRPDDLHPTSKIDMHAGMDGDRRFSQHFVPPFSCVDVFA